MNDYEVVATCQQLENAPATAVAKELMKPYTLLVKDEDEDEDNFYLIRFTTYKSYLKFMKQEYVEKNRVIIKKQ